MKNLLVLLSLFLLFAVPAHADTLIVQDYGTLSTSPSAISRIDFEINNSVVEYDPVNYGWTSDMFNVSQFDPSLGTLTGVEVKFDLGINIWMSVTAEPVYFGAGIYGPADIDVSGTYTSDTWVTNVPGLKNIDPAQSENIVDIGASASTVLSGCCSWTDGYSFNVREDPFGPYSFSFSEPSDLDLFYGTDPFYYTRSINFWMDEVTGHGYGSFYVTTDTGSGLFPDNFLSITYDYTPAPTVPIPTTILLLGSGLAGLFGFRRKLRKRQ